MRDSVKKNLEERIEQAYRRYGQQQEEMTLFIKQKVSISARRNPVSRFGTKEEKKVSPDTLQHVSVGEGASVGLCVRLVFDETLYATCGEDATKIKNWATKVARTSVGKKVSPPPEVRFEEVDSKVRIHKGEIIIA